MFNNKISTFNFNEIYELACKYACKNLKKEGQNVFIVLLLAKVILLTENPYSIIY